MGESRRTAPSVLVFTTRDGVPTRYYVVVTRKVTRHGCVNDHDDNENVDDNGAAQKISNGVAERPTAVFEIDVSTGEVVHDVIADRFRDETRALEELGRRHGAATGAADANSVNPLVPIARGVALCGYVQFGSMSALLLVTRSEATVTLPTGDEIMTVREAQWVRLPIRDPSLRLSRHEERIACNLLEMNLDSGHFYCETYDVTRPFGAHHTKPRDMLSSPSPSISQLAASESEFVWNLHLTQKFHTSPGAASLVAFCIVLCSGYAGEKSITIEECEDVCARAANNSENSGSKHDSSTRSGRGHGAGGSGIAASPSPSSSSSPSSPPVDKSAKEQQKQKHGEKNVSACMHICHIARRSSMHAGTRYLARGMNDNNEPGNEMECEQLVWRRMQPDSTTASASTDGDSIRFSSYIWRRGTVPIWWGQEIKHTVGEAEIYISDEPYRGTPAYFARLQKQYHDTLAPIAEQAAPGTDQSDTGSDGNHGFSITCINLLRCAIGKSELLLQEHFHEGVRYARREIAKMEGEEEEVPGRPSHGEISILNFDWHGNVKALGECFAVEGLWGLVEASLVCNDLTCGEVQSRDRESVSGSDSATSAGDCENADSENRVDLQATTIQVYSRQSGCLRYNCADSLDRTNAAAYFGCVQVLVEQCRRLGVATLRADGGTDEGWRGGIGTTSSGGSGGGSGGGGGGGDNGAAGTEAGVLGKKGVLLPDGWESRVDRITGKTFYIDHKTKKTMWKLPASVLKDMASAHTRLQLTPSSSATKSRTAASPVVRQAQDVREKAGRNGVDPAAASSNSDGDGLSDRGDSGRMWYRAPASGVWDMFGKSVEYVRVCLKFGLAAELTSLFISAGDLAAHLYTGSRAMHTSILHLLERDNDIRRQKSGMGNASNMGIAIQRRYLNVVHDEKKQQQLDLMVGARLQRHLPFCVAQGMASSARPITRIISRSPAACIACNLHGFEASQQLWSPVLGPSARLAHDNCWLSYADTNKGGEVAICVALSELASVSRILLHLGHGADDAAMPRSFDVYTGRYLDQMRPVVKGLKIPRCSGGGGGGGGGGGTGGGGAAGAGGGGGTAIKDEDTITLSFPLPYASMMSTTNAADSIVSALEICSSGSGGDTRASPLIEERLASAYSAVSAQNLYCYGDVIRPQSYLSQFVMLVFQGGGLASGGSNKVGGSTTMGTFEIIGESLCDAAASWTSSSESSHMNSITHRLAPNNAPEIDSIGGDTDGGGASSRAGDSTKNIVGHGGETTNVKQLQIGEAEGHGTESSGDINEAVALAGGIRGAGMLSRKESADAFPLLENGLEDEIMGDELKSIDNSLADMADVLTDPDMDDVDLENHKASVPPTSEEGLAPRTSFDSESKQRYADRLLKIIRIIRLSNKTFRKTTECLKLEILRLQLGLSSVDRDDVMAAYDLDPVDFDPNRFLAPGGAVQLRQKVEASMAIFNSANTQAAADKAEAINHVVNETLSIIYRNQMPQEEIVVRLFACVLALLDMERERMSRDGMSEARVVYRMFRSDDDNADMDGTSNREDGGRSAPKASLPAAAHESAEEEGTGTGEEEILSRWPHAAVVCSVPTSSGNVDSILHSPREGTKIMGGQSWSALEGSHQVVITVKLVDVSHVTRVELWPPEGGWTAENAPKVEVIMRCTVDDEGKTGGTSEMRAGAEMNAIHIQSDGYMCRFLSLRLSLPQGSQNNPLQERIQLNSMAVFGTRAAQMYRSVGWANSADLLADTLTEPPIMTRSLVAPGWFEAGRGGGTIVEVGLPAAMSWVSGFCVRNARDTSPPQVQRMSTVSVSKTKLDLEAFVVRVTVFQEQNIEVNSSGKSLSAGHIGDFLVPCCDASVTMCFDFEKPIAGRVFIFEVLGPPQRKASAFADNARAIAGSALEYEELHSCMRSLASSVKLFRYLIST